MEASAATSEIDLTARSDADEELEVAGGPVEKKSKLVRYAAKETARPDRIHKTLLSNANQVMNMTSFEERFVASDIVVSESESGVFSATINCLLCDPKKLYALSGTKYTVEINNWKRHVTLKHIQKGAELKKGTKTEILKNDNPRISSFFSKKPKVTDSADSQLEE